MGQEKIRFRYIILILICGCAFFSTCILFIYQTTNNFEEEIYTHLSDVSLRNSEIMRLKIENNLQLLKESSKYFNRKELKTTEEFVRDLDNLDIDVSFTNIAYVNLDGICYMNNGKEYDVSKTKYFQKAMHGESAISNGEIDQDIIANEVVYVTPIYFRFELKGALMITQPKKNLVNEINLGEVSNKMFTALIDEKGSFLSTYSEIEQIDLSNSTYTSIDGTNLYTCKGVNGKKYVLYTQQMEYNNWRTVSIIPADVVEDKMRNANILALSFIVIVLSIIGFILIQILKNHHKAKKEMERMIRYDDVTQSDNYATFLSRYKQWLREGVRDDWCVIHCDIKDFKIINSLLGYMEGDHLLKTVFDEIHKDCKGNEACARIEADRFTILWHMNDVNEIKERLMKIDQNICDNFFTKNYHEELTLYYGIYLFKRTDISLVKCIDKAKYSKKFCQADDKIMVYEDYMYETRLKERKMENRMYHALGKGEFKVYLQPKVDTNEHNKVISAEALIRWKCPDEEEIYPSEFIPLFEKNGFLENLDFYTFDIVCMSLARWNREVDPNLTVSFNVSRSYIFKENFAKRLKDITDIYGVNRKNIEIEIVESMIFEKPEHLLLVIQELKSYGFKIAMDDFGSGYSSLSMLKQIPFDIIKIDQGFFKTEENNEEKGKAIVDVIIRLANILHVDVVTEGIETKEQLEFVNEAGCHVIQGYYFYRPMCIEDFNHLVELDDGFDKTEMSKKIHHKEDKA